jgi:hypothetical protein
VPMQTCRSSSTIAHLKQYRLAAAAGLWVTCGRRRLLVALVTVALQAWLDDWEGRGARA